MLVDIWGDFDGEKEIKLGLSSSKSIYWKFRDGYIKSKSILVPSAWCNN
jgi:hypothetical protein